MLYEENGAGNEERKLQIALAQPGPSTSNDQEKIQVFSAN